MTVTFQPAIRKVAVIWLALTCAGPLHARGEPTTLENARIAVSVDKQLGAIRSIRDKELDVTYGIKGISFALEIDRGKVATLTAGSHQLAGDTLTFTFNTDEFAIRLHYRLGAGDGFIEKWFELAAKDKRPFVIQRATLEDASLHDERPVPQSCLGTESYYPVFKEPANQYKNLFGTEIAFLKTSEGGLSRMGVSWDMKDAHGEQGRVYGEKPHNRNINGSRPPPPPGVSSGHHGGSHGYLTNAFIESILLNRKPIVDIGDALNMTLAGIITHKSALKGGEWMKVPQYDL